MPDFSARIRRKVLVGEPLSLLQRTPTQETLYECEEFWEVQKIVLIRHEKVYLSKFVSEPPSPSAKFVTGVKVKTKRRLL